MNNTLNFCVIFAACALLIFLITSNISRIFKVIFNSAVGAAAIFALSTVVPSYSPGINAVTCLCCGFLGIPGFIMLLVLKFLMQAAL